MIKLYPRYLLLGLLVTVHSWQMMVMRFLAFPVDHWCARPNGAAEAGFMKKSIKLAIKNNIKIHEKWERECTENQIITLANCSQPRGLFLFFQVSALISGSTSPPLWTRMAATTNVACSTQDCTTVSSSDKAISLIKRHWGKSNSDSSKMRKILTY